METTFTVRTKSGKEFSCRLVAPQVSNSYPELGINGSWDKNAEIEVDGVWYECTATHCRKPGEDNLSQSIEIHRYNKILQDALNLPDAARKNSVHILCNGAGWHDLYNEVLFNAKINWCEIANSAKFTKVGLHHHSYYGWSVSSWDCDLDTAYMEYNSTILALTNALTYIKTNMMGQYLTGSDYDDYNSMSDYELPVSDIDSIINMSAPALAEAAAKKEKAEKKAESDRVRAENIKNGAIYFHCESAPHDEDLSQVVLNRPAPNKGLFTITHRIDSSLFSRIKRFGSYWDAEWLEDCDMFYSSPGWRFSSDAIAELAKDRDVYIDGQKVEL